MRSFFTGVSFTIAGHGAASPAKARAADAIALLRVGAIFPSELELLANDQAVPPERIVL
jgi:hypothetical protein